MSGHGGGGGGGGGGGHRRKKHGGGHGGGGGHGDARFLVTYADLLTVLMALFLVLWVLASIDLNKFKKFTQGLGDFGNPNAQVVDELAEASPGVTEPPDTTDVPTDGEDAAGVPSTGNCAGAGGEAEGTADEGGEADTSVETVAADAGAEAGADTSAGAEADAGAPAGCADQSGTEGGGAGSGELTAEQLQQVAGTLTGDLAAAGVGDSANIKVEARGLIVTIQTDGVLFKSGDATLTQPGRDILAAMAPGLRSIPNKIVVEGHTDSRPLARSNYDNWDLSSDRAISVLRFLLKDLGVPAERLAATGYGEFHPIEAGTSPEALARNRRVEIVVLAKSDVGRETPEPAAAAPAAAPTTTAAVAPAPAAAPAPATAPKTKATTTQTTAGQ